MLNAIEFKLLNEPLLGDPNKRPLFMRLVLSANESSVQFDLFEKALNLGGDLNLRDHYHSNTALLWVIANANNDVAMRIITHKSFNKAYLNTQDDFWKNTPLHLAIAKGYKYADYYGQALKYSNLQLVESLLEEGANPNLKDKNGNTPLHLACVRRDFDMIQALLNKGANKTIVNNDGKIPEELFNLTYEEAFTILSKNTLNNLFLLDRNEFESQLDKCKSLFEILPG